MKSELNISDKELGKGVGFERIRRITGYLVGTLDRFNTAKRCEVEDRVKHNVMETTGFGTHDIKDVKTA